MRTAGRAANGVRRALTIADCHEFMATLKRRRRHRSSDDALATRIIWDGNRAVGIEYLKGARLDRAASPSRAASGEPRRLSARISAV